MKTKSKILLTVSIFCIFIFIIAGGCASRSDYQKGYDAGAGDIVKDQYWIIQNRQKEIKKSEYKVRYYQFDAPENVDGVNYVPHKITVRSIDI